MRKWKKPPPFPAKARACGHRAPPGSRRAASGRRLFVQPARNRTRAALNVFPPLTSALVMTHGSVEFHPVPETCRSGLGETLGAHVGRHISVVTTECVYACVRVRTPPQGQKNESGLRGSVSLSGSTAQPLTSPGAKKTPRYFTGRDRRCPVRDTVIWRSRFSTQSDSASGF